MVKKYISIFLVLILFCSFVTVNAFGKEGENTPSADVTAFKEEIETLERFGFINEEFIADKNITRAEFVSLAMKIRGMEFPSVNTAYSDVTSENPYSGAIAAATDMGIISGYGDGNFYPDNNLTKEDAVKILVMILGYKVYAESYGGYPSGYLSVATVQGLLKNVPVGDFTECSGGIAAQLIYNALSVDILQSKTYPEESYYSVEGENPMTKWLDIFETEGVVNANEYSTLTAVGGLKEGLCQIGDITLLDNDTDISDYLGYPVKAFYKTENDENILMMFTVKNTVKETVVSAPYISPSANASVFEYYYDDTTNKKLDIIEKPVVIYNGKLYTSPLTAEILKPDDGTVKLTDTNRDNKIDLIRIDETEIYVVDRVVAENGIITDKYGKKPLIIENENKDVKVEITKDGDIITLSDIKSNDVLAVTKSEDLCLVKIVATSDKYRGTVTEKGEDYIYIDGDEYKFVKSNKAVLEKLQVGDYSLFCFTPDYLLAGYGAVSVSGEGYGYLITAIENTKGFDKGKTAECRMFTAADGVKSYTLGEEIVVNNIKMNGPKAIEALSDGGRINQLVKYTTSPQNDNVIAEISTYISNVPGFVDAGQNTTGGTGGYIEEFSIDSKFTTTGANYKYFDQTTGILDDLYDVSRAQVFSVPSDSMWDDFAAGKTDLATIENAFSIIDISAKWAGLYKIYNFEVYDVDENGCPAIVIEPGAGGSGDAPTQELFIFDYFGEGTDSQGYPTKIIKGLYKGEKVSIPVNESSDSFVAYPNLLNLRRGDSIRIALDANGNVSNLIKVFTFNPFLDKNYDHTPAQQIREMNYFAGAEGSAPNIGKRNEYMLNPYYYNEFNGGDTCESNPNMSWRNIGSPIWGGMMHRIIHCKISDVTSSKFKIFLNKNFVETPLPTKIIPISSQTNYYVYDEAKDEIGIGTIGDIDPDNSMQSVVIRMRYAVPGEILIINRSTPFEAEPIWLGRYWQARVLLNQWTKK